MDAIKTAFQKMGETIGVHSQDIAVLKVQDQALVADFHAQAGEVLALRERQHEHANLLQQIAGKVEILMQAKKAD
ncbi:MAG TPA: hypothetical protein VGH20_06410 [Myxococcales bacterium]|jgi:sensor histidine kinase regulating citrate/malate metabolism